MTSSHAGTTFFGTAARALCVATLLLLALGAGRAHALVVHDSDFIDDAARSHFNGFEGVPVTLLPGSGHAFYSGGGGPYVEDGISVEQINGDFGNDIWVTCACAVHEGVYGWYPNGGDYGYTRITMVDGSDFGSVGFIVANGGSSATMIEYQLYDASVLVSEGAVPAVAAGRYLGFSDAVFDEILIRDDWQHSGGPVTDGSYQTLALDAIEVQRVASVPEPTTIALLAFGLAGLGFARRRPR